jgi:hypothetical protein
MTVQNAKLEHPIS